MKDVEQIIAYFFWKLYDFSELLSSFNEMAIISDYLNLGRVIHRYCLLF